MAPMIFFMTFYDCTPKRNLRSYNHYVMELTKVIAELRAERAAIDEALAALDRIARATAGKRRGRPPAWMAAAGAGSGAVAAASGEPRRKRSLSPEVRKKMAEAQKKRWAAYRKEQGAVVK
jgi:hypothetical protein